jgi:acetolactate synthase I/II/III large subunit
MHEPTVSDAVVELLTRLGVRSVYGIVGGAIAPFADVVGRSKLQFYAMRHEAGAAFAATEASLAAGRPTACLTTSGPGLTNALTGIIAARSEGAHVIVLSPSTTPRQRGRFAVQEMSEHALVPHTIESAFDLTAHIESAEQLATVAARLASGFARPQGFVAHLSLPLSVQRCACDLRFELPRARGGAAPSSADLEDAAEALREPFVIWAGFGARRASAELLELAERRRARVILTPRAKGVFPEDHPLFVGVSGIGGHDVASRLAARPPKKILVLGTRLGEFSSTWDPALVPPGGFVHVDVDATVFGAAYPEAPTLGVVSDVQAFLQAIIPRLPEASGSVEKPLAAPPRLPIGELSPVRPQSLMAAVQRAVIDETDALVFAEPGNSFAWANHLLRFEAPRYRLSGYWASMGHMVTGAVGAALETGRRGVVITGDGAMLMLSELSSAAQYHAPVLWIVLNDARYGMTEQGMKAQGFEPKGTQFPRVDFASLARSVGVEAAAVKHERELLPAIKAALGATGPFVIDVEIDPEERAPFLGRVKALAAMGAH